MYIYIYTKYIYIYIYGRTWLCHPIEPAMFYGKKPSWRHNQCYELVH